VTSENSAGSSRAIGVKSVTLGDGRTYNPIIKSYGLELTVSAFI